MNGANWNSKRAAKLAAVLLNGTALTGIFMIPAHADGIETVTVTAERRDQNILDVPYNISAVSGDKIDKLHILDNAELMRSIPGVSVVDRGDRNSSVVNGIRIRGLNVDSSALGDYAVSAAATVSTYIDDTPLFANFLLTDIKRVEVLKGPQGTLYGANSLGGTVRYILNNPELGETYAIVSATGSSVDRSDSVGLAGTGTLNVALGDTAAFRVTVTRHDYPGVTDYPNLYVLDNTGAPAAPSGVLSNDAQYEAKKDADYVKQWYARAALYWEPTSKFNATASFMLESDQYGGRRATTLGDDGFGVPYTKSEVGSVQLEPSRRDVGLGSLEANLDVGFATLTSSTSFYDHRGNIDSENTGFYAQNNWLSAFYYNYPRPMASADRTYGDKAFIQELRLVSKSGGPVDYIVGAYYQNQELLSTQDSFLRGFKRWWDTAYPAFAAAVISDQDYLYRHHEHFTEAALYGDLTYHVTDKLDVTGGLRWFDDRSHAFVHQETGLYSSIFDSSDSTGVSTGSRALFKANVGWKFSDDGLAYATVSQGYRRGGTNATPTTGNFAESAAWLTYKPDTNVNYEVGAKGILDGLTYNVDLFYVDWHNPQYNTATSNWGFFAVANAQSATSKGLEAEVDGFAGDNVHWSLGYTYTDATLGSDTYTPDGFYLVDYKGATLPGAPKNVVTGALDFTLPQLFGAEWTAHVDGSYQSQSFNALSCATCSPNTVPGGGYTGDPRFYAKLPGFSIFDASTSLTFADWYATLWVKNIFDADGVSGVYNEAYMGTAPGQNYYGNGSKALITLPRTVGITLSYKIQ